MKPAQPVPSPHGAPDEQDDLARAAAGEAAAFERIMRRHNRLLFRTARSLLRNDAESEEAVQDAYLKAWGALGSFRGEARLSTWLVRIVMNQALTRLRRRSGVVLPFSAFDDPERLEREESRMQQPEGATQDPQEAARRTELRRVIERHVDQLPEQYRTVFVLRALEEMSVQEVAQSMDIPEATVRTRFFRARAHLREALARDIDFAMEDAFSFAGARCDRIVAAVLQSIATSNPGR